MKKFSRAGIIIRVIFLIFYSAIFVIVVSCQKDERSSASANQDVLVKSEVKITVGGIVYENVDARIRVSGFNEKDQLQWEKEFEYVGPSDTFAIQLGLDHYNIELLDKWGVNDAQTNISGIDLWNGRLNGNTPVTFGLGGAVTAKNLTKYITYIEVDDAGNLVFQPESRVSLYYNQSGRIESIHHESYNPQTLQFNETSVESFDYNDSTVSTITATLNGNLSKAYLYEGDKITETDYNSGIVTTQITTRHFETISPSVTVDYSFSNGNSIDYSFIPEFKNIAHDKTISSAQLCNQGDYSYDKNINPFRYLGYMDFNFQNWSVNNKLTERADFLACSYSTLIPLFHYYTYDQDGYPTEKITTYKSSSSQNKAHHSKMEFYYE